MKNHSTMINHRSNDFFTPVIRVLLVLVITCTGFLGIKATVVEAQTLTFYAEINKSFSPISIIPGETSRLSVTIYNPNAFEITNAAWTDNLAGVQTGIKLANPVNAATTCGGSVLATAGGTTLALNGGTVPAQSGSTPGSCTVSVDVTSTTPGNLVNTIPAGTLSGSGNGGSITNSTPASATLTVSTVLAPSISKSFTLNTIWAGVSSLLTINITNNDSSTTLTNAAISDSLPANVKIASAYSTPLTNCGAGASLSAVVGSDIVSLANASITPGTTCVIKVYVTSTTAGTYTNSIPAGAVSTKQGVTNASPASATLAVQALNLTKSFSPTSIAAGGVSTVTITLQNPTATDYTGATLTDSLPNGLLVYGTPASSQCNGGTVTYNSSSTPNTVTLSGGTIPSTSNPSIPGTCTFAFQVTTAKTVGTATFTNTIAAGALTTNQGISNPSAVPATLNTQAGLTLSKSVSPASITINGISTYTVTLQNRTTNALTGVQMVDTLPANLTITGTPSTTCTGGTITYDNQVSPVVLTMSGATINAASSSPATPTTCTVTFKVTTTAAGSFTNTIGAGKVTSNEGYSNVSAVSSNSMSVSASAVPMTGSKSFSPAAIAGGANTRLRIQLSAPADTALTNFSVTDNLPSGVTISNSTAASKNANCSGGTLTAVTGSSQVKWTGGTISAGAQCQIDVYVTSSTQGTVTNIIYPADITNDQNRTVASNITNSLSVTNFSISKAFYPTTIAPNGKSTLTITLTNTSLSALTSVNLTDALTTMTGGGINVYVADNPDASTTCGSGSVTATAGTQTIKLTNGIVPAQVGSVPGICTITVNVKGTGSNGTRTNTLPTTNVSAVVSDTGATIAPVAQATANLTISGLTLNVVTGFIPTSVFGGSVSTLSVQLLNPNNAALSGIAFTDNMPTGMIIANPANLNTGTCGGTLVGSSGSSVFSFSGGTLAASSSCTLTLSVTMTSNANLTNTIGVGAVTTFNGASNTQSTSASLTNLPGASVSKYFLTNPLVAEPGNYSMLVISIQNTGSVSLTGMGLVDNLPAGLTISGAVSNSNGCGGALTAAAGTSLIKLEAGVLAANATCEMRIPVAGIVPGSYKNTIAVGTLTNDQGTSNTQEATDTLVITASPAITLSKTGTIDASIVAPAGVINPGDKINYTFTIKNTGNVTLSNVSVKDPDSGVILNGDPIASLAPGVTDDTTYTGSYILTQADIDAGTFTNTASVEGTTPYSVKVTASDDDIQTLAASKSISLMKSADKTTYSDTGQVITYTYTITNTGNVTLNGQFTVSDDKINSGTAFNCGVSGDLAPAASRQCTATYTTSTEDLTNGSVTNTAVAGGAGLTSNTASTTVTSTWVPTLVPTDVPTDVPTETVVPSDTPTDVPTENPSETPTTVTPESPTDTPTDVPTEIPSDTPTDVPTEIASDTPTDVPTDVPSETPSIVPSEGPTDTPVTPTDVVTETPIVIPTEVATETPTVDPSSNPTDIATEQTPVPTSTPAPEQSGPSTGGVVNAFVAALNLPSSLPITGFTSMMQFQSNAATLSNTGMTLSIPRLLLSTDILDVPLTSKGWNVNSLDYSVGWLEGTAKPGTSGNSAISGHISLTGHRYGPFLRIAKLKAGDQVIVYSSKQKFVYEVKTVGLVKATDVKKALPSEKEPWLTLITCATYDPVTHSYVDRTIVRAKLVQVVDLSK